MTKTQSTIESALAEIRAQLQTLAERIAKLEQPAAPKIAAAAPPRQEAAVERAVREPIPEQDLLAISAALAARFGVRVRIRQIRLISSAGWAQEGRVSIQASHRLH